jgi:hypothetical protein
MAFCGILHPVKARTKWWTIFAGILFLPFTLAGVAADQSTTNNLVRIGSLQPKSRLIDWRKVAPNHQKGAASSINFIRHLRDDQTIGQGILKSWEAGQAALRKRSNHEAVWLCGREIAMLLRKSSKGGVNPLNLSGPVILKSRNRKLRTAGHDALSLHDADRTERAAPYA